MAKTEKVLTYNDKYINKLYRAYNSVELANKLYVAKANFKRENYDSFEKEYIRIITAKDDKNQDKYQKISSLNRTDKVYLAKILYINYSTLVQGTNYDINLDGVINVLNRLLEDNWDLYSEQRTERAVRSLETEDEERSKAILREPCEIMMNILNSYKNLIDTINLNEINMLRY